MAVGGSLIAASLIGFFSGALTGGLGLFPLAGGMMAFGAAASEAARSNAEKDRLRMMRDNLLSLADETRPG